MIENLEPLKKLVVDSFPNDREILFDNVIDLLVKNGNSKIYSYEIVWFLIEHGVLEYNTHDTCRFLQLKK